MTAEDLHYQTWKIQTVLSCWVNFSWAVGFNENASLQQRLQSLILLVMFSFQHNTHTCIFKHYKTKTEKSLSKHTTWCCIYQFTALSLNVNGQKDGLPVRNGIISTSKRHSSHLGEVEILWTWTILLIAASILCKDVAVTFPCSKTKLFMTLLLISNNIHYSIFLTCPLLVFSLLCPTVLYCLVLYLLSIKSNQHYI